ncbi:cytochrome P450 3A2-like isoform X2 [Dermacentor andersoni]|uniref:cytochrome P450 3A2-like isoform X2 n=1 Tax=Dermacentor andersoni TaxID=34620 RepID=UPI002417B769|nr:cytochrome P450 3A2-like isoform X2 [Dermacentor andersoni]
MALMNIPEWLLLVVTACVLFYLYAARSKNYWKNQNVVHEKFSWLFGPATSLLYKIIDFFEPILDNMMTTAPVDIWRKIRPSSSPAFTMGKLRRMNDMIQDCAKITSEHLGKAAEEGKDVDLKWFYSHYALDVIAKCAFGTELDSYKDASNEFVTKASKAFSGGMSLAVVLFVLCPALLKVFKVKLLDSEPFRYFKEVCVAIIQERRRRQHRHEDFLQLMMDAQEGTLGDGVETAPGKEHTKIFDIDSEVKNVTFVTKALSEDEALAQCVLFFVAAHDATSSVLAFAAHLLALNPDAQDKLRREADECFATHGNNPSLDVISKLPYLHCVVSETMRLYPPAPRLDRTTCQEYVLGDTGIRVPKDSIVTIPIYAMHRDPEFFPDPEKFIPERFNDENAGSIRPYSYLPFGAGPRNCIGMRMALQITKLCLLHSVHTVQFVPARKAKASFEFAKGIGILKPKEVTVGITKR